MSATYTHLSPLLSDSDARHMLAIAERFVDFILDRLEAELRRLGKLSGPRPEPPAFAPLLVQTFVRFPSAPRSE